MGKLGVLALACALLAGEAAASDESKPPAAPARAKVNLVSLFSGLDYPAAAVAAREQGIVGFSLDVGPDGRVAACAITSSSGSAELDSATCRLIQSRARFTPALDADGLSVADKIAGRISWKLPPVPPPAG
jgi:protein TonB